MTWRWNASAIFFALMIPSCTNSDANREVVGPELGQPRQLVAQHHRHPDVEHQEDRRQHEQIDQPRRAAAPEAGDSNGSRLHGGRGHGLTLIDAAAVSCKGMSHPKSPTAKPRIVNTTTAAVSVRRIRGPSPATANPASRAAATSASAKPPSSPLSVMLASVL